MSDDNRAVLLRQGRELFLSGDIEQSERLHQDLLAQNPDDVQALIGAALCASTLRRDAKGALALLDRALALAPDNDHAHQTKANVLNTIGDFPNAVASARKAIQLNPTGAYAYVNLADSTKVTPNDPIFAQAAQALKSGQMDNENRMVLNFALGKAHQDCGNYDQAFHHFAAGNELKPKSNDQTTNEQIAKRLKTLYSPAFLQTRPDATKISPRPIFVIGMPRSGTTLLERMLVAHPEVTTAGESPEMNNFSSTLYPAAMQARPDLAPEDAIQLAMSTENLTNLARGYVTKIAKAADDRKPNIIDKMPTNFWNLGLIFAAFADAPVLHMRRHPLDTCLSNYIANFRVGLDYSNRLDTLGAYFKTYIDLMAHWETARPGRILHVDYETLVSDPEAQTRRILDHCGLEWCEACVHPEDTQGVIATASRWQARQEINTGSVQKWRRYEKHLGPLVRALGNWGWITQYEASRFE